MKKSRLYLSYAGFIATVLYGSMNFICLVFYDFFDYERIKSFVEFVLGIDIYTWHIYGVFSIFTLVLLMHNDSIGKKKTLFTLLHISFLIISFICIWKLFEYSFWFFRVQNWGKNTKENHPFRVVFSFTLKLIHFTSLCFWP